MRKYCLNCGKKFYPAGWTGYPQTEYTYDYENHENHGPNTARHKIMNIFFVLQCLGMKEWFGSHACSGNENV